ncbi:hypothetical protein [Chromobacterium alticapitis]|uniref:DUF2569 domain-containing protein n=1 Tax=Chromobacterium alticapitis TaxID=2073169 RepID=A0A2S5DEJ9_9NEIS|nr:hypothetical protein [Chromobacterium alticapitis]POZ61530.1 hypothetical protein C2I19_13600 [Chromobacterium alticapitis]
MNRNLLIAGGLSLLASLLHLACILGGPAWYLFFGAPPDLAAAAGRGEWWPALATLGIAAVLAIWALYAFSAAGWVRRLPLLRPALSVITTIYLLRGLTLLPIWLLRPDALNAFAVWSSLICLAYGLFHAAGLRQRWRQLA